MKTIRNVSAEELGRLGAQLLAMMRADGFDPEAIVSIAEGGTNVVRAMPTDEILTFSCTLRRPSSASKRHPAVRSILAHTPLSLANALRRAEDWVLERRPAQPAPAGSHLLEEAAAIGRILATKNVRRVAIVDDAVDSGVTMSRVQSALRATLPVDTVLKTATITRTRHERRTLVLPDYSIFKLTLIRFPWSYDRI